MTCTNVDCGRATSLFLCTTCILELDDLLKEVPVLVPLLDGVRAGTSVTRKPGSGGGGGQPGSRPPGNLDAMMLQAWFTQLPTRAHQTATEDPEAGRTLYMARLWITQARTLIWGAEPETIDRAAAKARLEAQVPTNPMPTRDLKKWLSITHGIEITGEQLRQWVHRKKLQRANDEGHPTYYPAVVLAVAKAQQNDTNDHRVARVAEVK